MKNRRRGMLGEMRKLKQLMVERYQTLFDCGKKDRKMVLREDPSVEIVFLNPEEIDEELELIKEMAAKDDAVFTVKVCIDKERMGNVAREIVATCEIEEVEMDEKDGKLYIVGAMMFAFYTNPQVLENALGNGKSSNGDWLFELFFPHTVKRGKN